MSIFKRSTTYWYEFTFHGQRIRKSTRQRNRNTARELEAAHRSALVRGELGIKVKADAPTFREFAPRFVKAIETQCHDKPATIKFYKARSRPLLDYEPLADAPLDAVDEALIEAYTEHRAAQASRYKRPLSPSSINAELRTLRRMLRLAEEWKVLDRVPRVRLLRGERTREFILSRAQEDLYLKAAGDCLRDVATLLLDTGLRLGEALSLDWKNVHLKPAAGAELGYLTVRAALSKSSKARNVPLPERSAVLFSRRSPKRGLVFQRENGEACRFRRWTTGTIAYASNSRCPLTS